MGKRKKGKTTEMWRELTREPGGITRRTHQPFLQVSLFPVSPSSFLHQAPTKLVSNLEIFQFPRPHGFRPRRPFDNWPTP